jgi:hypothetical protein
VDRVVGGVKVAVALILLLPVAALPAVLLVVVVVLARSLLVNPHLARWSYYRARLR